MWHLISLILNNYFTKIRICCYTWPVVLWEQVSKISHYKIIKILIPEDWTIPEDQIRCWFFEKNTDQNFMMNDKTQNTDIKAEVKSSATKHF